MRQRAVVLSVSLIAHVAVFAALGEVSWKSAYARGQARAEVARVVPAVIAGVEDVDVVEVTLVALPERAAKAPAPATATAAVTATVTASVTVTAAATATAPDLLRMRSTPEPEPDEIPASESPTTDPDLSSALAGATVATIADRAAVAPPPPQRSHLLKRMPGGGARVDDAVTTMTVDPDGTAHFHDKGDFDFHFGPSPAPRGGLDPAELAANGLATCGLDNSGCEAPSSSPGLPPTTVVPLFTGKADLSDYLMRKLHVGDPYGARKRALLERTFDERVELGAAYRAEQLARSAELMRRNLVQLWASVHDPVARRADLFALWDECAEGDGELGQAGQRARAMVIGWIRSRLPEDSGDGYTPAEIAALERKSSSAQRFAPY